MLTKIHTKMIFSIVKDHWQRLKHRTAANGLTTTRSLEVLTNLKLYFSTKVLQLLYFPRIQSHNRYSSLVWMSTFKTNRVIIDKSNRIALYQVQKVDLSSLIDSLYMLFRSILVNKFLYFFMAIMFWNCFHRGKGTKGDLETTKYWLCTLRRLFVLMWPDFSIDVVCARGPKTLPEDLEYKADTLFIPDKFKEISYKKKN